MQVEVSAKDSGLESHNKPRQQKKKRRFNFLEEKFDITRQI